MHEKHSRICAVITETSVQSARRAIKKAGRIADIIEVRLDYLRDFDFTNHDDLRLLLEEKPLPTIITCRSVAEGGAQKIEDEIRLSLLAAGARQLADYCDIEAASYADAVKFSPDLQRLILSYHNFDETPEDLSGIYERITQFPAAIHKIATRAKELTDSLSIFRLLDRARIEDRKLIAIAIGEPGLMTRIIGPAWGSFLTYASVEKGRESAPGQLTCEELRNIYRVNNLSRETSITGIIGKPVAHSVSPAMHNRAFAALGLDGLYHPFEVTNITDFFSRFVNPRTREIDWRLRGFSVTIPHKTSVAAHLDELDGTARMAGAANTVVIDGEKLIGYNTDIEGAMKPLDKELALEGASCGVIGAGGAARAVVCGLTSRGARVNLFARDTAKAREIVESFGVKVSAIDAVESSDVEILINATPVGMKGHSEETSPVPRAALKGRSIAYDLVYNPLETRFLREAREEGCRIITGIEMLVEQAALQFELWTGQKPPVDLMRAAALEKLVVQNK